MQTWKEKISKELHNLFEFIGLDPFLGLVILITPVLVWRINDYKKNEKIENWQKLNDVGIFLGAIGIYIAFILNLLGVFD